MHCGLPTPGAANAGHYAQFSMNAPAVDCDSRLFTSSFTVRATIPIGATLRYTLDGSTPTLTNGTTSSDGLFDISKTTVLRLRLFAEGRLPSGVTTRTYIYRDKAYYLPIVAITTAPANLYDDMIGCYVNGKNGIPGRGSKTASNLNMDWERPVNFEYLTADGQMVINQEASFEVVGGYSRHFPPASFKVQAKKLYDGNGSFSHPVFAGKPYGKHKQLLIRNGGNNNRTHGGPRLYDAVTQQILSSSGYYVDTQDYQPAHVFVNGNYLAMMNVREPNNRFHGCANYGYDDDAMDGFEYSNGGYQQRGGTRDAFDRLIALSEKADTDEGYVEVCRLLDIEEFVRYMAAICYTGSYDWLLTNNNVKGYRTQDDDGKFHFLLFDQDLTWERTNNVAAIDGILTNEVLVLYNNLKRNPTFRRQFVTAYCVLHGSVYAPERCKALTDSLCNLVKTALTFDRRTTSQTYEKLRVNLWGELARRERMQSLTDTYGLDHVRNVTIATNLAATRLHVEGLLLPFNRFAGTLCEGGKLWAECADGYAFLGWQNQDGEWITRDKTCTITTDGTYTAVFDTALRPHVSPLCINELSAGNDIFVSEYGKRSSWIELYNRSAEPIDVSGLCFSDDPAHPDKYRLDAAPGTNTLVPPDGHIVVWADGRPSSTQLHLPFKLNSAEGGFLSLQSADGAWKDSIRYDAHPSKTSIGRYPDGGCACYTFYRPTIDAHNMSTLYDAYIRDLPSAILPVPAADPVLATEYYTLDGRRTQPRDGIYIKVCRHRSGQTSASKILMKNGAAASRQ